MAYMNQDKKKALVPQIKAVLKKYGVKGTIGVDNYSSLVVNVGQWDKPYVFTGEEMKVVA